MTISIAQADALLQLSQEVAAHLGVKWTARLGRDHAALLSRKDGVILALSISGNRVEVRGLYPRGIPWPTVPKGITVALQRGPRVIAREIKRRYLPAYTDAYTQATHSLRQYQDWEAARREAINGLADLVGVATTDIQDNTIYLPSDGHSYGVVTLSSADLGNLHLNAIPTGLIKALLQVFRDWGKGEDNG